MWISCKYCMHPSLSETSFNTSISQGSGAGSRVPVLSGGYIGYSICCRTWIYYLVLFLFNSLSISLGSRFDCTFLDCLRHSSVPDCPGSSLISLMQYPSTSSKKGREVITLEYHSFLYSTLNQWVLTLAKHWNQTFSIWKNFEKYPVWILEASAVVVVETWYWNFKKLPQVIHLVSCKV